jgi:hypothetical protein
MLGGALLGAHAASAQTVTREVWNNVSGTTLAASQFTSTPSSTGTLTSFEAPSNVADNYAQRVSGYLTPATTGTYTFWISGDDNCELYLTTNGQKNKIAQVLGWTSSREWNKEAGQKSAAISLQAGQQYYIEALMKEGGGGDNLAVGWAKPGQSTTAPSEIIPGSVLSTTLTSNDLLNEGNFSPINTGSFTAGTSTNRVFYSQIGNAHAIRSATGGNADAYLKLGAYGNQVSVGLPGQHQQRPKLDRVLRPEGRFFMGRPHLPCYGTEQWPDSGLRLRRSHSRNGADTTEHRFADELDEQELHHQCSGEHAHGCALMVLGQRSGWH